MGGRHLIRQRFELRKASRHEHAFVPARTEFARQGSADSGGGAGNQCDGLHGFFRLFEACDAKGVSVQLDLISIGGRQKIATVSLRPCPEEPIQVGFTDLDGRLEGQFIIIPKYKNSILSFNLVLLNYTNSNV